MDESRYLGQVEEAFNGFDPDIGGVSAGFDTYLEDWGWLLKIEDYKKIGEAIQKGAEERCGGRRFAVLEGGYHPDLRWCVKGFWRDLNEEGRVHAHYLILISMLGSPLQKCC